MSAIVIRLATVMGGCGALAALETLLTKRFAEHLPLLAPTSKGLAVPRLYGLVLLNAVGSAFVLFALGMKVGMSRSGFVEKAKKDGDEHAEARFSYPKVYAEGFGKLANDFNCVQRGHQQALETYPQILVCSLIGGLRHPVLACIGQTAWMVARWKWAAGYATGDPKARYGSKWAFHIWTSMLLQFSLAASTGVQLLLDV
mmetsp:Transcript_85157/g.260228  ORF Transcript_85157/g.260228 Transcript_85157/m.260228 type:complete len:200 (-) Transcript_85157:50-649(-)